MPARRNPLTVAQVLRWADKHYRRTGRWPRTKSGEIPESPGRTWDAVELALRRGRCGNPGDSLPRLLARERGGGRAHGPNAHLTEDGIVAWARAHTGRHGVWPTATS